MNNENWLEMNGDPIIWIEWMDGNDMKSIRQIKTTTSCYRCEVQRDGTLLLVNDEDSVECDYWLAPGEEQPELWGNEFKQVQLPTGERMLELKELLAAECCVDEIFYCGVCDDYTFEDRFGVSECGHLRYIDAESNWGGCGYEEERIDYEESFLALSKVELENDPNPTSKILEALKDRNVIQIKDLIYCYRWLDINSKNRIEAALKYLDSLSSNVPESYFDQAVSWLTQDKTDDSSQKEGLEVVAGGGDDKDI